MTSWGNRVCAGCRENLSQDSFSSNQWYKPVGVSRCRLCVQENVSREGIGCGTRRSNESSRRATFDWDIYASGSFRHVVLGQYTGGPRTGQRAVAKYFKPEYQDMSISFFNSDEAAVEKALHLISSFNNAGFVRKTIRLNAPEQWTLRGLTMFVEPYIDNFEKFNSNSGWVSRQSGEWYEVLQALSHYSYHVSSGMYTLCDLQGGIYRNGVVLTDPVVCSRRKAFGPTDLGAEGISTFFARHQCTRFCQRSWTRPRDTGVYYPESSGTSMEYAGTPAPVPYRHEMSSFNEDSDDYDY